MKKSIRTLLAALFLLTFSIYAAQADPPAESPVPEAAGLRSAELIAQVESALAPAEAEFLASVDAFYAETFDTELSDEAFVVYSLDGQPLEEGQGQPAANADFLFEDAGTAYYIAD